jgi:hypothetical protein
VEVLATDFGLGLVSFFVGVIVLADPFAVGSGVLRTPGLTISFALLAIFMLMSLLVVTIVPIPIVRTKKPTMIILSGSTKPLMNAKLDLLGMYLL